MHTAELSQEPMLFLPQAYLEQKGFFGPIQIPCMPRKALSAIELRQYGKTVVAVDMEPWCMRASHE